MSPRKVDYGIFFDREAESDIGVCELYQQLDAFLRTCDLSASPMDNDYTIELIAIAFLDVEMFDDGTSALQLTTLLSGCMMHRRALVEARAEQLEKENQKDNAKTMREALIPPAVGWSVVRGQ